MANYTNPVSPAWPANVRRLSATDPADATDEESPDNKTGFDLVARTQYLKNQMDALNLTVVGGTDTFGVIDGSGNVGLAIANVLETTNVAIDIHPTSNPAGTWGEWWATYTDELVTVRTSGTYSGTVRWTLRRTTEEV